MSDDEKREHLQIGIVMGELRAGVERLQRASDQHSAQNAHILETTNSLSKVAENLATHMVAIDHRLDILETRPRMGSVTTETFRSVVAEENEKQSAKNSESIRVAQVEVVKPLEEETARQTKAIEHQTRTLTRWTAIGWVLAGLASGLWQAVQHLLH